MLAVNPFACAAVENGLHAGLQHVFGNVGFVQPQLRAVGLIAHRHALNIVEPFDGIGELRRVLVDAVGACGVNHHVIFRRLRVVAGVGKGVADKRKDREKQRHARHDRHHRRAVFFAAALEVFVGDAAAHAKELFDEPRRFVRLFSAGFDVLVAADGVHRRDFGSADRREDRREKDGQRGQHDRDRRARP